MDVKKVIIDCDAGTDDAVALIVLIAAHKEKRICIEGITCVSGNTHLDNVVRNVYRTLRVCNALDIPVYRGADRSLLQTENTKIALSAAIRYHGEDGLSDIFTEEQDTSRLHPEHAVMALRRIVSADPGKVSLICLAPLTNVALAIKLFPGFINCLEDLYVMGGNITGKGNTTPQAEFNFYADPESAHIVLNSIEKSLFLLPWETCLTSTIEPEWRHNVLGCLDNPIVRFMNDIEWQTYPKNKPLVYQPCDVLLAAIVCTPRIVVAEEEFHADVELHGNRTRGQVVLDHMQTTKPNVRIITAYNSELFKEILLSAVRQS